MTIHICFSVSLIRNNQKIKETCTRNLKSIIFRTKCPLQKSHFLLPPFPLPIILNSFGEIVLKFSLVSVSFYQHFPEFFFRIRLLLLSLCHIGFIIFRCWLCGVQSITVSELYHVLAFSTVSLMTKMKLWENNLMRNVSSDWPLLILQIS